MRYLYTIGFYLALPFIFLRFILRHHVDKADFKRLKERVGLYDAFSPVQRSLWLHAVSYGEAVAAEPLITQLKSSYPTLPLIITTMTLSGAARIRAKWGNDKTTTHLYIPYDIPYAIKRFLDRIQPCIGIIMETELWPNMLHIAGQRNLPLFLANARLSPKSFQGYQRLSRLIPNWLKSLTWVGAQTEDDAKRFINLGIASEKVFVLGNMKFDIKPPKSQIEEGLALKKQLPFDHILVAASTHANEEEALLEVFARLRLSFPNLLLVLVPRHPERFAEVKQLCLKKGHKIATRSLQEIPQIETSIFLGDTMGELYFFYALADVAFVGGSLVPVGGHNLLEPAALKLPIVSGKYLFNFKVISTLLKQTKTLYVLNTIEELEPIMRQLLNEKSLRETIGQAGFEILEKNQGATLRYLEKIDAIIGDKTS